MSLQADEHHDGAAGLRRRDWLAALAGFAVGRPASAQAATPLVGVLASTGLQALDWVRQGLGEAGFVEGRSVAFAFRSADGDPSELPRLARDIARLEPKVIFCQGPAALDAAVHATSKVPIVAIDLETDPVRSGLVRSVRAPGTNVTGLFLDQSRFAANWFELLRQVLPRARDLELLWDTSTGPWQLGAAKAAAKRLDFDVDTLVVRDKRDLDRELNQALRSKPDALVLLSSPLVRARSAQLAEFCTQHRLPAISPFSEFALAGGLMAYGPDARDFYRRVSTFVVRILKGARADRLPLEMPDDFRLVVNEGAATQLGLTLPPALLARADQVVR